MDVVLKSPAEWDTLREQIVGHGGCTLPLNGPPPAQFSSVPIRIQVGTVVVFDAVGQAVQAFGPTQMAFLFEDAARAKALSLHDRATVPGGVPPVPGLAPAGAPEPPRVEAEPVWKRYEGMTRAEKIHLAKYGNADERRAVLRDKDSTLHAFVLSNPGFTPQEIATLMKTGQVSGSFVQKVAERREVYQNVVVAEALVFHPATPIDLAERLVSLLSVDTVRRIAKQGALRSQILAAARKKAAL